MGKTSNVKYFGSGGASSRLNNYGYSGYKATEDEWRRPNVAQVYSAEVEEEVKPEGNPLDPYYQKQRSALEQQKIDDLAALDRRRVKQRQEAAINNELLMKYLPQLNKASGLTDLGVAQSANVDALSRYAQNIGNIESNFQQGVSDLERAYRSDSAAIDAAERGEILALRDKEEQEASDRRARAETVILSGHFDNEDALSRYLDAMGFEEGTPERSELEAYATPYLKKEGEREEGFNDTVAEDGTKIVATYGGGYSSNPFGGDAPTNLGAAGTPIKVNAGDTTLILESQGLADKSVADAARGVIKNGEVFTYNDGIYLKDSNNVYVISGSNGEYGGDSYNALLQYLNGGHMPDIEVKSDLTAYDEIPRTIEIDQDGNATMYAVNGEEKPVTLVPYVSTLALNAALDDVDEGVAIKMYDKWYVRQGNQVYEIQEK